MHKLTCMMLILAALAALFSMATAAIVVPSFNNTIMPQNSSTPSTLADCQANNVTMWHELYPIDFCGEWVQHPRKYTKELRAGECYHFAESWIRPIRGPYKRVWNFDTTSDNCTGRVTQVFTQEAGLGVDCINLLENGLYREPLSGWWTCEED